MGTGKIAPIENNHTRFLYKPLGPTGLCNPMSPHITEASNLTLNLGRVLGLSGRKPLSISHKLSIFSNIHHDTARFTVPTTRFPTNSHIYRINFDTNQNKMFKCVFANTL
ncbi:hypothetical protein SSX86_013049 [Deinandra increscens subsp. villosa]|uniref:Uncharacterized protein n=1 Tax=Deinandra increscens subsp. villosa TaxID=3103831 RepID=A0AAP0DCZ6_9ASTR